MKDKNTIRAKELGYKARSVFKLKFIQDKYHLIKRNNRVLDLGCWPGSWLQYVSEITKDVIGVDLKKTEVPGIKTYEMDIFDDKILDFFPFDVVISDAAPNTTGDISLDQERSFDISKRAFDIAMKLLKPHGNFLVKIFQSQQSLELLAEMRKHFTLAKSVKPEGSKMESKEIYFLGMDRI